MTYIEDKNKLRVFNEKESFMCESCQEIFALEDFQYFIKGKEFCLECYIENQSQIDEKICENCQELFEFMDNKESFFDGKNYYCNKCINKKS